MKKIAKKSIVISVVILFTSLVVGAVIGCISRNTVYSESVQIFLGKLNENKKVSDLVNIIFGIECITVISLLFLSVKISSHSFNKLKCVIFLVNTADLITIRKEVKRKEMSCVIPLRI